MVFFFFLLSFKVQISVDYRIDRGVSRFADKTFLVPQNRYGHIVIFFEFTNEQELLRIKNVSKHIDTNFAQNRFS